jgi:hypothetical protein
MVDVMAQRPSFKTVKTSAKSLFKEANGATETDDF